MSSPGAIFSSGHQMSDTELFLGLTIYILGVSAIIISIGTLILYAAILTFVRNGMWTKLFCVGLAAATAFWIESRFPVYGKKVWVSELVDYGLIDEEERTSEEERIRVREERIMRREEGKDARGVSDSDYSDSSYASD